MPVLVDIYLNNITWDDSVKIYGNTVSDLFYSGPIDAQGYTFDEINLTYSITFGDDGMIKTTQFYGDVQLTATMKQRIIFYDLSLFTEENNNENGGGGGTSNDDSYVRSFDSRVIVLSSITLVFGIGLFYVLKKSRGLRR